MGHILNSIDKLIESRANTEYTVSQIINARERMDKDLTDLTTTIDVESLAMCQNGGDIEVLLSLVQTKASAIFKEFKESNLDPTEDQLNWLSNKLHQLLTSFRKGASDTLRI